MVPETKRVPTGQVATRVRDLLRQIAAENELEIISGKVAADHVHMFISYRARRTSRIVQWLKGNEFARVAPGVSASEEAVQGQAPVGGGYFAVTSGTITDEMINEYINEQEGEAVQDDSRFVDLKSTPLEPLALQARVVQL